ncbi:hypothetical protein AVEN_110530-1 [Araneus ventricosus]|uniref:Uncharacterized protein n=1 Tax=Araneus ventricosus TaxID=182803 RepID=A0A4Y2PTN4_ARAVE|nr:hypothetical protein AVEN_110530-1 [Araneus ventricosus]
MNPVITLNPTTPETSVKQPHSSNTFWIHFNFRKKTVFENDLMHIRYETDRHESACVQGTHRLQKTEHFQNRSTRIGSCARNASSAKVDYFQTGLQKSVCVQVAIDYNVIQRVPAPAGGYLLS